MTRGSATADAVRDRAAALHEFCFVHAQLFVIPADHLTRAGIGDAFARVLNRERNVSVAWVAAFNRAYCVYWERAEDLYRRAPDAWFPPRLQNICIVTDRGCARPYHQPLFKSSWSLDAADFEPERDDVEFAVYQLLHAERLAACQDMPKAIVSGLSYWLTRSDEEVEQFCAAAQSSPRIDAEVFTRLAAAMPWVRTLFHPRLRPPPPSETQLRPVSDGSLLVPQATALPLRRFVGEIRQVVTDVVQRYRESVKAATAVLRTESLPSTSVAKPAADLVTGWLAEHRPPVLIADGQGTILWDPEAPHACERVHGALGDITADVAQSLVADLDVVGLNTERFLSSLRDPQALPRSTGDVDRIGGVYLHDERQLIVYCLAQSGLDPLREPAPAYHRLLLAARTVHEWGHLADAAGWLAVPASLRSQQVAADSRIDRVVATIFAAAPPAFRDRAAAEAHAAGETTGALVRALVRYRMPDYVSNVLARRFLHPSAFEAYVRGNVYAHFDEDLSPTQLLARYGFEFQYLGLSLVHDPLTYFLQTTWFSTYLLDNGVIALPDLEELFAAIGALCACYRIDDAAIGVPALPDG